jgi:hypothetical protein
VAPFASISGDWHHEADADVRKWGHGDEGVVTDLCADVKRQVRYLVLELLLRCLRLCGFAIVAHQSRLASAVGETPGSPISGTADAQSGAKPRSSAELA